MHLLPVRPDAQAEAVEVDVLALLALLDIAAVQAQAQEGPEAGRLAGVLVAVVVGVPLEDPAPAAALAAGVRRLLLPALEHARDDVERLLPGLAVADVGAQLVGRLLGLDARQLADFVEEPVLQGTGAPGRPEVARDPGRLEHQA